MKTLVVRRAEGDYVLVSGDRSRSSTRPWPMVADERLRGRIVSLGAGERDAAVVLDADAALSAL